MTSIPTGITPTRFGPTAEAPASPVGRAGSHPMQKPQG